MNIDKGLFVYTSFSLLSRPIWSEIYRKGVKPHLDTNNIWYCLIDNTRFIYSHLTVQKITLIPNTNQVFSLRIETRGCGYSRNYGQ